MTVKAAIFDLDGTLVNLPIDYGALYEEFKKITGIRNIEPITKTIAILNPALRGKVFEAWATAEFAVLPKMTPVPEGLKLYRQYEAKMRGLVTMQSKKTVESILKTLNLSFQATVTREDSLDRAEQIRIAIEKLRLEPESVIVIGDRETDKTAAEKTGCKFKMVKGNASLV